LRPRHGCPGTRACPWAGLDIKDIKPMFTHDMIDEINNYDREKIVAQAKAYKI
jgi:hypothetical protein